MNIAFKSKTSREKTTSLSFKMTISLLLGVVVGILILILKSNLISSGNNNVWNIINSIFFQDISVDEGKNAIGLFYIIGQLFLNSLQLIIVPMIFSSIALSMCHINDTKKLGRISKKTLLNFLTTSILALIVAIIFGYIANTLGLFTVNIGGNVASAQTASSSNPLLVLIDAVPSNNPLAAINFISPPPNAPGIMSASTSIGTEIINAPINLFTIPCSGNNQILPIPKSKIIT